MARWLDGAPVKTRSPNLKKTAPRRPRIGGGEKFPFNRRSLGAKGSLDWRRAKLTVAKFAGIEIRWAARREEEDEVVRRGERMEIYRATGYL